jgi:hypothetical protein
MSTLLGKYKKDLLFKNYTEFIQKNVAAAL